MHRHYLIMMFVMAVAASPAYARDIILSIGVGSYSDPFWPALKFPANDARSFASKIGEGTGRAKEISLHVDGTATLIEVRRAMKKIEQTASSQDNLIIYISAHGSLAAGSTGDLEQVVVLSDTKNEQLLATALSHDELRKWANRVRSKKKLVVLATCHSGIGKSRLPTQTQELLTGNKGQLHLLEDVSEGVIVLAASARGETAREDAPLGGDIYSRFFLDGLTAGDRNQDGAVTGLEAHDYARDRTFTYTKGKQRPTVEVQSVGNADITLRGQKRIKGSPILNAYGQDFAGLQLQTEKGPRATTPTGVALQAGQNRVEIFSSDGKKSIARYSVNASEGESYTIEDIIAPPPYRLGASIIKRNWDDQKFRQAVGSDNGTAFKFSAGSIFKEGLFELHHTVTSYSDTQPVTGVDLKVQNHTSGLTASWIKRNIHSFEWSIGAGINRELLAITLLDQGTQDKIHIKSICFPYHLKAMGGWAFRRSVLFGSLSREVGTFDFNDSSRISASKTNLELGVAFTFGGIARRLP